MPFVDRQEAGERLAALLRTVELNEPIVLGLPRGGVPVAAVVAAVLNAPLDVLLVRKLGAPGSPEFALGAVSEAGAQFVDSQTVGMLGVTGTELTAIELREQSELARRAALYRGKRERLDLTGRTVVIVDDGVATGSTAAAACLAARALGASSVVVAVPVAPWDWQESLREFADALYAVETPRTFHAVGLWYTDFRQTSDEEVINLLLR